MSKSLNSIYTINYDPKEDFLHGVIAIPARRALEKEKIDSLEKLSDYSEKEIMQMHGFGKNTMEKLKNHMKENQMFFKEI
ncbi:DNA-directed RNA polymerase subunit alpha C-terminal domain-containing protein [Chryseobacterium sp. Bi04]|uniref:DNA-directed RNA polymerase subunit alpha C-terminal domain-containing protein n=1 Tax=Chryseobacterium sp. Bi04 TaxID=2822345 RepID=UPI001E45FC88|nr:DNA-directed RNA polymerase subunit alpha C-terminal domain-containing protein [Chryseobacterium sp. Bi04]